MVKANGLPEQYKKMMLLPGIVIIAALVLVVLAAAILFCLFFYLLGSVDDPFRPQAPQYQYTADVTGLDGFVTENGSAMIMLPLPAIGGTPILSSDWWVNYPPDRERHHGMTGLAPVNTSAGPMLGACINMTDYYLSYAGITPIAISPGQNGTTLPEVVPARINKSWSFDDVHVIASGGIGMLDYPAPAQGRAAVRQFLEAPLSPAENETGSGNFTTCLYIDPALKPLHSNSTLHISGVLSVTLNHNKVNASEEGKRLFEYHNYVYDETIPGGVTGFVPVTVHYTSCSGLSNCV